MRPVAIVTTIPDSAARLMAVSVRGEIAFSEFRSVPSRSMAISFSDKKNSPFGQDKIPAYYDTFYMAAVTDMFKGGDGADRCRLEEDDLSGLCCRLFSFSLYDIFS